jgi:uncharacterized protein YciI
MSNLYLVICRDKPDHLDLRKATRSRHLDHVKSFGDRVKVGGPFLTGEDGTPCGSMLIIESESMEALEAEVRQDPYFTAGLFESVEIKPWIAVAGAWHPEDMRQI